MRSQRHMMSQRPHGLLAALACFFILASCSQTGADKSAAEALYLDGNLSGEWPGYGNTYGEQHFSPLSQIDTANIGELGLVWSLDLPPGNSASVPVAVGGKLFLVTGYSIVHAVDAATGHELWTYDPKVPEVAGRKLRVGWGARGLAWWNGKVFVGTQDGRLIGIDAATGEQAWNVMTVSPDDLNYITGAPRVFDGKVIVGFGGADVGRPRGYVTAYDAETGEQAWRWHTVPGNPAEGFENAAMEKAASTWSGEWWKFGGGGTVWNAISYDPETRSVIIGTGNGTPWNHKARSDGKGDNLFLCSIVALDADTGVYKWHYQVNPGESWDYTATMEMALADLEIDGRPRKVLITAPKNGFLYVIDRLDGSLVSAEPIAKVTWASRIDAYTGRPVENPKARYPDGSTFELWPRTAHSWQPMAYSPQTRLAYVPVSEGAATWRDDGADGSWAAKSPPPFAQAAAVRGGYTGSDPLNGTSHLVAWDPVTQRRAWDVPTPGPHGGGVLATGGGLVFQGRLDDRFDAYSATTGKLLWNFDAKAPILGAPISYSVDGRQYVTVITGWGTSLALGGPALERFSIDYRAQARRVLTFAIGGTKSLPPKPQTTLQPVDDPDYREDRALAKSGAMQYGLNCAQCHGPGAIAAGAAPDLRTSTAPLSADTFANVLNDGALLDAGMPKFAELDAGQRDAIRQYIRQQAKAWRETKRGPSPPVSAH